MINVKIKILKYCITYCIFVSHPSLRILLLVADVKDMTVVRNFIRFYQFLEYSKGKNRESK